MKNEKKERVNNMEILVDQLEQEWSCSKEGKCRLEVSRSTVRHFGTELADMVETIQQITGKADGKLTFQDHMELTKRAYILMRLGRKLSNGAKKYAGREDFTVMLDKEEYRLFVECYPEYQ